MDDSISRNAALALVVKAIHGTDNKEIQDYLFGGLRKQLWALPSEQLRPKGEWDYEKINSYSERIYCSECGSHAPFVYVPDDHYGRLAHGEIRKTNFCPNCGADMRGEQDE